MREGGTERKEQGGEDGERVGEMGRTGNRLRLPAEFGGWAVMSTGLVGSSSKGLFKEKDYTLVAQR